MSKKVRLFLDANVLISVAWKEGSKVSRLWSLAEIELLTSEYVLDECIRNLPRPDQRERFRRFLDSATVVKFPRLPVLANAPLEIPKKDQPVLAGAVLAQADYLVTGDARHFGKWYGKAIHGVRIEPPGSFPHVMSAGRGHPGYK